MTAPGRTLLAGLAVLLATLLPGCGESVRDRALREQAASERQDLEEYLERSRGLARDAMAALPEFKRLLARGNGPETRAHVLVDFGLPGFPSYVRLTEPVFRGGRVTGYVEGPGASPRLPLSAPEAAILDWEYREGGLLHGGFFLRDWIFRREPAFVMRYLEGMERQGCRFAPEGGHTPFPLN